MKHHTEAEQLIRTTTPGRLAALESDVLVPALQALIIAAAVGLLAGTLILLWIGPERDLRGGELWTFAGRIAGTAAALSLTAAIVAFVLGHRRALYQVEEWIGRDLDGDGYTGKPEPPTVRAEVHDVDKRQTTYADLPAKKSELRRVAIACLYNGRAFSRPALAGIISQRTYNRLAKAMVNRGLAHRLPGNQRELSAAGRAILRRVLEE